MMQEQYNFSEIEKKHQATWLKDKSFYALESSKKPKFYCLSMLPYPSGKLHMGHVRNYTIGDVLARFHHMKGFNVLQPFGWDAFGLPAENAALQTQTPPSVWTYNNIAYMKNQLQSLGLAVDWSREFATCSPSYYKHQQWLFIQLYKKGIIYRKNGTVNWDPVDQTVLANEQVIDGKGWRSGAVVIKKEIPMYYFKITNYAEELLNDLDNLTGWPDQVKAMQRNWIGKSKGMEITFCGNTPDKNITVFTTRPDTLMGVSYLAISAEHPLVKEAIAIKPELVDFVKQCKLGGVSEAELAVQEKVGIFSGLYVKNPISHEQVPVWIANYVLMNYGSGAVMGVPAHDQRDFEFVHKYNLPIKIVIQPTNGTKLNQPLTEAYLDKGTLVNSLSLDGLDFEAAFKKIESLLAEHQLAQTKINYRLRDWGISRQRYWGCPIPIIHCEDCGEVLVADENLPVILPENIIPDGKNSPLATNSDFYKVQCPQCNKEARRETDTMDTFVDSSWYYARYTANDCTDKILDQRVNYWTPVDQYIGGVEHAILHLLYARFFHKCLRDLNLVNSAEPFKNLLTQGMVLAETYFREDSLGKKTWINPQEVEVFYNEKKQISHAISIKDGKTVQIGGMEKMSKSKNNGVDPQTIIEQYGADTARLFMMFAAPPELSLEWSDNGIEGASRFIRRLWRVVYDFCVQGVEEKYIGGDLTIDQKKLRQQLHQTIAKVTNDIAVRKQFNTAIAAVMELLNSYLKTELSNTNGRKLAQEVLENIILMLSPIIPHVCQELWSNLNPNSQLLEQNWPQALNLTDVIDEVEIVVQVNGKLRSKILIAKNLPKEEIESLALNNTNVQKFTHNQIIKKIIIVPNKIINIVV